MVNSKKLWSHSKFIGIVLMTAVLIARFVLLLGATGTLAFYVIMTEIAVIALSYAVIRFTQPFQVNAKALAIIYYAEIVLCVVAVLPLIGSVN